MCFSYSERRNEIQQLDVDYCKSVKESKDVEELLLTDLVKKTNNRCRSTKSSWFQ